jgi:isoleucyl-tRNA synthetase
MTKARELITEGLARRAAKGIKVRQPLSQVTVPDELNPYADIIKEELNVKGIKWIKNLEASLSFNPELTTDLTPELKREGIARDLVRFVQSARKNAGFNVEDRIKLKITSENAEITDAAAKFKDTIFAETLATGELDGEGEYTETVKLDGQEITVSVARNR